MPFLAVTGSNGKSTTTTLLDFMLRKGGLRTMFGGNIGNALTEEILKIVKGETSDVKGNGKGNYALPDFAVVEVSSFQLDSIDRFRPHIAVILNITPDHLDRYRSFTEYGLSKARISENQAEGDFILLNADDPEIEKVWSQSSRRGAGGPDVLYFSRSRRVKGMYYRDGNIYCNIPALPYPPDHLFIDAGEIKIKGVHNRRCCRPSGSSADSSTGWSSCANSTASDISTTLKGRTWALS
jgi:UDP-N-acetylmuramoylalanine--D-glutamate ligase